MTIAERIDALLDQDLRTSKPRTSGITVMIDKGQMGANTIADFAAQAGPYCDFAKIAWGSSLITGNLVEKIEAYRRAAITPTLGGTLFEYAYLRNKVPQLFDLVNELKIHLEISDGVIDLPRADKLKWISKFASITDVWSEVGGKINRQKLDWKQAVREELSAGSKKIVVEGRELGPAGMREESDVRGDVVEAAMAGARLEDLVFEAFERRQQTWLIKRLGPNVNLGNIPPTDLLTLESFRRGLKEHTLLHTAEMLATRKSTSADDSPKVKR